MPENNNIVTVEDNFNIPTSNICTLDISTGEGKKSLANALNNSDPLKNHMNEVLHLIGVVTTPGVRAVSGADCTNNYLVTVTDDGEELTLFSQSDGVTRSLKVIVALWRDDLAAGTPVDVKCVSQSLNNGNTLKTIVPA